MTFGRILVVALLAWPFVEIATFIAVGREIGILRTLGLMVATSLLGALLLRVQGVAALRQLKAATEGRADPAASIGHAALIALGGVFLLLPGFASDVFGVLMFVPPVRSALIAAITRNARVTVVRSRTRAGVVDLEREEWRSEDVRPAPHGDRPRLPGGGDRLD